MGCQQDGNTPVDVRPFGVVIGLFGFQRDGRHEGEGGHEIGKLERPHDCVAIQFMRPVRKRRHYLAGSQIVSLQAVAEAINLLVRRHHIVVEGAGAATLAAALAKSRVGPTVCVLSGGHLDPVHLATIVSGNIL